MKDGDSKIVSCSILKTQSCEHQDQGNHSQDVEDKKFYGLI